jgi:6-phosphofructo-2-kinase/fructose-2,6-biphosphatase 4
MKDEVEELILNFFFVEGGQVVIYDANNGSAKHRRNTLKKFEERGVHVIFLGMCRSAVRDVYEAS